MGDGARLRHAVALHDGTSELPPELAYGTSTSASGSERPVTEIVDVKKSVLVVVLLGRFGSSAAPASSVSDEEAKARRAKFRVIEGG